jgi:c-di-GMP-binding flagellar brake protein YcgR
MDNFQLNSKVELINSDGHGMQGTLFDARDDIITVSVVPTGSDFKLLRPGDDLEVVVYDIKNLVTFQGILETRESGDFILYRIKIISEFKKFQRREYVRVSYTGAVRYSLEPEHLVSSADSLERKLLEEGDLIDFTNARAIDLSGGGIRLSTWEKLKIGQIIALIMSLEGDRLIVKGEVRHGYTDLVDGKVQYCYGIMFNDITELKIDTIVRYVFKLMRKARPL